MIAIGEVAREEIAAVGPDAPIRQVVEVMRDKGVEGVLVVDGRGHVLGSVGDEQVVVGLHAGWTYGWWRQLATDGGVAWIDKRLSSLTAAEVMLGRPPAVDPAMSAISVLRAFHEHGVTVMPVIDRGALVGVVYRGDLVKRLVGANALGRAESGKTGG